MEKVDLFDVNTLKFVDEVKKDLTPIEKFGNIYVKRDDKFSVFNVSGGKVRSAYQLMQDGIARGYKDFVTAGSRMSPQCEIVSYLAEGLNVKCHLFMPRGNTTSVIENISNNKNTDLHRTHVGYNNVITRWAYDYAVENNYYYIPFGMECADNVNITKHQVQNIPKEVKRIVIPVGSGMSFISVCNGLETYKMYNVEVFGVSVGKDPRLNINKYLNAPNIKWNIVKSDLKYEQPADNVMLDTLELDKIYEAKCLPYLKSGDLLWVVGKRL